MDEFEKYIRSNKSEFDEFKADSTKLWKGIDANLDAPKIKVLPLWKSMGFKVAASFLIILGIVGLLNMNLGIDLDKEKNLGLNELEEIDMYYQGMVRTQVKLVEISTRLNANDKKEFLEFMDELDEEYSKLKVDLEDNLDNERVLVAIVNNYKKRIELIENLLKQINDSKENTDEDAYIL